MLIHSRNNLHRAVGDLLSIAALLAFVGARRCAASTSGAQELEQTDEASSARVSSGQGVSDSSRARQTNSRSSAGEVGAFASARRTGSRGTCRGECSIG